MENMANFDEERFSSYSHKPVTIDGTKKILEQMEKCICKIRNNMKRGTGFFCNISYKNKTFKALITNHHIIDDKFLKINEEIKLSLNDDKKFIKIKIGENRKIYSNKIYDTTIIEIKEEDKINNFLELDDKLFIDDSEISYEGESIYILQYPNGEKASVSYGILKKIENHIIKHFCSTNSGSSGSPILNLSNNKVMGLHQGNNERFMYKHGIFLKYPINDFIENYIDDNIDIKKNNKKNQARLKYNESDYIGTYKNEIKIQLKINDNDVNKKVYFLGESIAKQYEFGALTNNQDEILNVLNDSNTVLFINDIKYDYKKFFIPDKKGIFNVRLRIKIDLEDCSFMFNECQNIIEINFPSFCTEKVSRMNNMFYNCINLTKVDMSSFNTIKLTNMEYMFGGCKCLENINLSSFDTENVTKVKWMFDGCEKLRKIIIKRESYDKLKEGDKTKKIKYELI